VSKNYAIFGHNIVKCSTNFDNFGTDMAHKTILQFLGWDTVYI